MCAPPFLHFMTYYDTIRHFGSSLYLSIDRNNERQPMIIDYQELSLFYGVFECVLLHCPNQHAAADNDTGDEKVDEAVAHDIFSVKASYSQGW